MVFDIFDGEMKKYAVVILLFCCQLSLSGQELKETHKMIPSADQKDSKTLAAELFPLNFEERPSGPFDVARYAIPIDLMSIDLSSNQNQEFNMLAVAREKEVNRRSQIRKVEISRQLDQIKSQVRVFLDRDREAWDRSSLDFDSKPLDRSLRNEALRDNIRQSYINPYYHYYNPGSYNYYRSRPGAYYRYY